MFRSKLGMLLGFGRTHQFCFVGVPRQTRRRCPPKQLREILTGENDLKLLSEMHVEPGLLGANMALNAQNHGSIVVQADLVLMKCIQSFVYQMKMIYEALKGKQLALLLSICIVFSMGAQFLFTTQQLGVANQ